MISLCYECGKLSHIKLECPLLYDNLVDDRKSKKLLKKNKAYIT